MDLTDQARIVTQRPKKWSTPPSTVERIWEIYHSIPDPVYASQEDSNGSKKK